MSREDLELWLDFVYGSDVGDVLLTVGLSGYYNEGGKYKHKVWTDGSREPALRFAWPESRTRLADEIIEGVSRPERRDIFACPYLLTSGMSRAKGNSANRRMIHTDLDGLAVPAVTLAGSAIVGSGTPGHGHVYVRTSDSMTAAEHDVLCRALSGWLGGDSKYSDNDVLRPVGTLNHKNSSVGPGHPDAGAPLVVHWIRRPDGSAPMTKSDLATALGIPDLDAAASTTSARTSSSRSGGEWRAPGEAPDPIAMEHLPSGVQAALATVSDPADRSRDTARVVYACARAGMDLDATWWAVRLRDDLAQRLDEKGAGGEVDVERLWNAKRDEMDAEREYMDGLKGDVGDGRVDPRRIELPPPGCAWVATAKRLLDEYYTSDGVGTLAFWGGGLWLRWDGSRWAPVDEKIHLLDELWIYLDSAYYTDFSCKPPEPKDWNPNPSRVAHAVSAIRTLVHTADAVGEWSDGSSHGEVVPVRGGYLEREDSGWHWRKGTASMFNLTALAVEYDLDADMIDEWLTFLGQIFDDDQDAIDLLQEFFGYLVSGRTNLQKALQLLGPKRSGKGTILRVLDALFGDAFAVTSLSSLSTEFGLEPLIGASVVVIGDAKSAKSHHTGKSDPFEIILGVVGEDAVTINRKGRPILGKMKLPCRVIIAGNDVLAMPDDAGALHERFLFLKTQVSFAGSEDHGLTSRLTRPEVLASILKWSLDGLDRLNANRGKFTKHEAGSAVAAEFQELGSLTGQYVESRLTRSPAAKVRHHDVYADYVDWCDEQRIRPLSKVKHRLSMNQVCHRSVRRPGSAGNQGEYFVYGFTINPRLTRTAIEFDRVD